MKQRLNNKGKTIDTKLPLSVFTASRKLHKKNRLGLKKVPYIHKEKPQEQLISVKLLDTKALLKEENFKIIDDLLRDEKNSTCFNEAPLSQLPHKILKGDIDSAKTGSVREKYNERSFPLPKSKTQLKSRVESLLPVIPRLLAGEEELSYHYTLASAQRKRLRNSSMSASERWDIQWAKYVGGFYGLRRQTFISTLIQEEYADILAKNRNKTLSYWYADMFCTYVLANEIILRLMMEDLLLLKKEAEKLMKETVDYGTHVADEEIFADDLTFEEFKVI